MADADRDRQTRNSGIAIIGFAGRFPGAPSADEFWELLAGGIEARTLFGDDELIRGGVRPADLANPRYVKAGFVLDDVDLFDAEFFGYSPSEAQIIDPQQRIFLECAWESLEMAGYAHCRRPGPVGVFAGVAVNTYLLHCLHHNESALMSAGWLQVLAANEKDYLPSRVSYKCGLTGPSVCVQSACSTSLVAVHSACQSLLAGECRMALAGGASVRVPDRGGYLWEPGSILAPDGHCRAFDDDAAGTVLGNGVGVVVLKREADAYRDGDTVYAVIRGSAVNNDGGTKAGFTAPSPSGQEAAITKAFHAAGVTPDSISYVEAHGTGTRLGDPIEVSALTRAYQQATRRVGFCAIGSLKTNVGHLDAASGVAAVIKVLLALKHQMIPASLNYRRANSHINFADSPFYVNTGLRPWPTNGEPRRAGVSSFGIGGTNAHVILEESLAPEDAPTLRPNQLLVLSGKVEPALEQGLERLAVYLAREPHANVADVAFTLSVGRTPYEHRAALVCRDTADAEVACRTRRGVLRGTLQPGEPPSTVFMFPGQGTHEFELARELYQTEGSFREHIDHCGTIAERCLGLNLAELLYSSRLAAGKARDALMDTRVAQPALLMVEYALGRLLMGWGIRPTAVVGHSLGEYAAACIAGVWTIETAMGIVVARAKLVHGTRRGTMVAVPLSEEQVQEYLGPEVSLAAINAVDLCVLSGDDAAISRVEALLRARGIRGHRLRVPYAYHSPMMDPIAEDFRLVLRDAEVRQPDIPLVSGATGRYASPAEVVLPSYWIRHLTQTVRFTDALETLRGLDKPILVEVGPGRALSTLARRQPNPGHPQPVVTALPGTGDTAQLQQLLEAVGRMWVLGVDVDWNAFYSREKRHRIALPTYAFQRKRYWLDPKPDGVGVPLPARAVIADGTRLPVGDWFYAPVWTQSLRAQQPDAIPHGPLLLFADTLGLGERLAGILQPQGCDVVVVRRGDRFVRDTKAQYTIRADVPADYCRVAITLKDEGRLPRTVLHLWGITDDGVENRLHRPLGLHLDAGYHSLFHAVRSLALDAEHHEVEVVAVTNDAQCAIGTEKARPLSALATGPVLVIPKEFAGITCRTVDISLSTHDDLAQWAQWVLEELADPDGAPLVALRGGSRWVRATRQIRLGQPSYAHVAIGANRHFLITGGLGGIGLTFAKYLAASAKAKLTLIGRSTVPGRKTWDALLASGDTSSRLRQQLAGIRECEATGGEVLVISADVADFEQMRSAKRQAEERFGAVNAVIHAAGVPDGRSIALKTAGQAEDILRSKVLGTTVLDALFGDGCLDFMLLCSSLTALFGEYGQADYCSANAFLDAFAHQQRPSGRRVVAVNWDVWQGVGMAEDAQLPGDLQRRRKKHVETGITPAEGVEALLRVLASPLPQVIVSACPIEERAMASGMLPSDLYREDTSGESGHDRPDLHTPYQAPAGDVEVEVAGVWQEVLGINGIGRNDDFIELGGHSLLAAQVVARIEERLGVRLSMPTMLAHPTVAHLAACVTASGAPSRMPGDPVTETDIEYEEFEL